MLSLLALPLGLIYTGDNHAETKEGFKGLMFLAPEQTGMILSAVRSTNHSGPVHSISPRPFPSISGFIFFFFFNQLVFAGYFVFHTTRKKGLIRDLLGVLFRRALVISLQTNNLLFTFSSKLGIR